MSVKVIYFVHATTTDNENHKASGWNPGQLSETGNKQSIALRDYVDYDSIDIVISSNLNRAIQSAEIVFEDKKEILNDPRIRECNYGDLTGEDSSLVKYEEHIDVPFPNGESLLDVEARIRDFCEYLKENFDGKTVAVVAHKAPQLALDVITKGCTWQEAIDNDWRKHKAWQPGWEYVIK